MQQTSARARFKDSIRELGNGKSQSECAAFAPTRYSVDRIKPSAIYRLDLRITDVHVIHK